jgi:hypothetical protein
MLTDAVVPMRLQGPAARLYELLLPFEHVNFLYRAGTVSAGSTARALGVLATLLERWDAAEHHFLTALEMNRQMRARPWVAHTQYEYARMLLVRNDDGDRVRGEELLRDASRTAVELGMRALGERIARLVP